MLKLILHAFSGKRVWMALEELSPLCQGISDCHACMYFESKHVFRVQTWAKIIFIGLCRCAGRKLFVKICNCNKKNNYII